MAARTLPSSPSPATMTIGLVSAANELTSAFGGGDQEILRKGTRHALTFRMPVMSYVKAMDWGVLRKKGVTVLMTVHQPGFDTGAPGSPVVDGAGQAGTSFALRGLTPHYVIRADQFLSVITNGQRFLYQADTEVVADAAGEVVVPLMDMLRWPHLDGDTVEIAKPMIEGFVRDLGEWAVGTDRLVGLQFTVRERE